MPGRLIQLVAASLLPGLVAATSTGMPVWPFLLAGLTTAVGVAVITRSATSAASRHDVDDGFVEAELVNAIPVTTEGVTIRITVPLAAKTHSISPFLCSLPASTAVEVVITGMWDAYLQGQNWRDGLLALEGELHRRYQQVSIRATRWMSAMMTVEEIRADGGGIAAYVQPLEATGTWTLYIDIANAPTIRERCRAMTDMIFESSDPIRLADLVSEDGRIGEGEGHADR